MGKLMRYIFILLLITAPALGQQLDPAFMQKAINALQTQRNEALDSAATAQARAAILADELTKAQDRIKELEPRPEEKK
jgi:hypothetical protein